MSKIAIILGRLVIGGTTMDTLQAAQYLQNDHEVLLIAGGGQKDEFEAAYLTDMLPQVRHERINGFSGSIHLLRDYKAYRQVRKVLRKFQPDIVHTHTAKAGLIGRLAAAAEKVPVIVHTYHGLIFHGYYSLAVSRWVIKLERWLATKSTRLIALSQTQQKQIVEDYGVCKYEKTAVVPLGISLETFADNRAQKRADFRKRYRLQEGEIAIGIVGRIVPIKNHLFFLRVAWQMQQKQWSLRYFIIGDGHLRKKLQTACEELQLDHTYFPEDPRVATITFTSWITEVDKAMAGLDIIALTSFNEGTPVSLMEAQAAAKPVIATKAGGIDDIVQNNSTGFTIAQGDEAQFVEKLQYLVANPVEMKAMGEAGELFAHQQFRKQRQVEDLTRLYGQLLAEAK
ncbi:MAG TPA: glycosyltransferase [Phnomibacter sp.]|nr:glycosyltransferase [Phnomibacter sp.]